jgi:undecaprenyl-diphosphatase
VERRAAVAAGFIAILCFTALAAAVARGAADPFDRAVRAAIHDFASPSLTRWMRLLTELGSKAVQVGVSAGAIAGLLLGRRRAEAVLMAAAMSGAELWLYLLKSLFHRVRPEAFFGIALPRSYSFPSGHALLSMCCYGVLAALAARRLRASPRRILWIFAAALILAIGFSRVYLGVHYATDVIAGYLVAAAWIAALWTREPRSGRSSDL